MLVIVYIIIVSLQLCSKMCNFKTKINNSIINQNSYFSQDNWGELPVYESKMYVNYFGQFHHKHQRIL